MTRGIRFAGILLAGAFVMATDYVRLAPIESDGLRQWRDELVSLFNSRDIQLVEVGCLGTYILGFATWRHWHLRRTTKCAKDRKMLREMVRTACLLLFCGAAIARFFAGPSKPAGCTDPAVLLFGIVVGQVLEFFCFSRRDASEVVKLSEDILTVLLVLFTIALFVQPSWWHGFEYHGQRRWQGIWWNPNTFGLLMAVGVVLVVGRMMERMNVEGGGKYPTSVLQHPATSVDHQTSKWRVRVGRVVLLAAAGMMGVGLLKSYSRGAWLGAALGLGYLAYRAVQLPQYRESRLACFLRRNWAPVGVLLVSVVVLGLWMRRDTENVPARRVLSVANVNDFSWRNRVVAYEGGLQMMAARPWLGFGWGRTREVYEAFYMPANLDDGRAIDLNDYFRVGLILGLPALACFIAYLYLSLANPWGEAPPPLVPAGVSPNPAEETERWLGITCRAGLIVLLVGFWLQQGLFWLSLTVPFWVLLELGYPRDGYFRAPRDSHSAQDRVDGVF
jgi:O-antigen ligase